MNLMDLKLNFKVQSFKDSILDTTPKNTGNQEHVTTLLDNITFLKDQLHQKDKNIDSLISQLSKKKKKIITSKKEIQTTNWK